MTIVTRAEQLNKDYPSIYKRYPRLTSYFNNQTRVKQVHFCVVNSLLLCAPKYSKLNNKDTSLVANETILAFYTILSHYVNCVIKAKNISKYQSITYISFFDSRIGSISIDSSSSDLDKAKIKSKHRFDIDLIINSRSKYEILHHIYSYISEILGYVDRNHYSNELIYFDDVISKYCIVNFDSYLGTKEYDEIYNRLQGMIPIKNRNQLETLASQYPDITVDTITHNHKGKL